MNYKKIILLCLIVVSGLTTGCASKDPSFYEARTTKRVYDKPDESKNDLTFWGVISSSIIIGGSTPNQ